MRFIVVRLVRAHNVSLECPYAITIIMIATRRLKKYTIFHLGLFISGKKRIVKNVFSYIGCMQHSRGRNLCGDIVKIELLHRWHTCSLYVSARVAVLMDRIRS